MEKQSTPKHGKRSTQSNKTKPVKVVYISNPMKIKATPSEFRAVVQQFTGRYATPYDQLTPTMKKDYNVENEQQQQQQIQKWLDDHSTSTDTRFTTNGVDISNYESSCREDQVIEDMILTPQMFEGFPSLLSSDFGSS